MSALPLLRTIGDGFLLRWLLLLSAVLFLLLLGSLLLFRRKGIQLWQVYIPVVLSLGLCYSFVLPPLSAPDEVVHYIGAYELSSRILGRPSPLYNSEGQLLIRAEDTFIDDWQGDGDPDNATVVGRHLTRELYEELHRRGFGAGEESGYHFTLQLPVETTRLAYLFPALGFSAARLLGLGGFGLLYFGRWMNLLFFTMLGGMAVRRTPVGREFFFGVSLLPMLLELASSLSYDCFLLGLSFYLTAVMLDLALSKPCVTGQDVLTLSLLAVLLSPCKMVYSLLFLGCFLIPPRKFRSKRHYFGCILLIGTLMLGAILWSNLPALLRYVFPAAGTTHSVDWVENAASAETYDLQELLKTPIILLKILRNTVQIQGGYYLYTMAGGALGHLEEGLGLGLPGLWFFYGLLLLLNLFGSAAEPRIPLFRRLLCFLSVLSVSVLLLVSMLTAYTPLRTDYALGVQGRYFLPLLPLFAMSFHGRGEALLLQRGGSFGRMQGFGASALLFTELLGNAVLLLLLFLRISLRTL